MHGIEVCDRVWLTCCALHNFLLEEDGLDGEWGATRYHLDVEESTLIDKGKDMNGNGPQAFIADFLGDVEFHVYC